MGGSDGGDEVEEVVRAALANPVLAAQIRELLQPPEVTDDGWLINRKPVPYWEPWKIDVKVSAMPDGSLAVTGLRIEPRDDYDGSIRDQQLTAVNLRRLPLKYLREQALFWRAVRDGADCSVSTAALVASHMALDEHARKEQKLERESEVGRETARLEEVAQTYLAALQTPAPGGPRKQVAESLGISVRTVDRLLARAREVGVLAPYFGRQGRLGKETTSDEDAGPTEAG